MAPASAQKNYAPPLRGPLLVTGTFGELRGNHYHAGLDFRASVGTPVYAVQDGFVSQIAISSGGYGQAVYIDHPDGHRSVYGHLERLAPELRDTVRARQLATERFPQTLLFDSLAFPVQRGQKIGGVGNRGHSFGAHLHFEMRSLADDAPLNPLAFGFSVPDHRSPQIRSLRVYELDDQGRELTASTYRTGRGFPDTIVVRTPHVGIGVKAYDRQDAMPNQNGPFTGGLFVDSIYQSGFEYSRIPFEDTRYLNALTDYAEWRKNTSWFHKLWAGPQVESSFVKRGGDGQRGQLKLRPGQALHGHVQIGDFAGNQTMQEFVLLYRPGEALRGNFPHQYFLPAGEESVIQRPTISLHFPDNALYEDCYFRYAELPDASDGHLSDTYQLHDPLTPLHRPVALRITPPRPIPDALRQHVYLGTCDDEGKHHSYGGHFEQGGSFVATVHKFGDYALFLDTIPPRVRINSFPPNLSRHAGFSVLITDDVSGGSYTYRGQVDGQWVLLEYDAKNDKLSHNFADSNIGRGRHRFELTLTDARGNTTVWARNFTR